MDILDMRCAGLDIHRDTIVACVRLAEAGGVVRLVEGLRHHHHGAGAALRMAGRPWRHVHRDGSNRRVLEAGLGRPGGGL